MKRNYYFSLTLLLITFLLFAVTSCGTESKVGELQTKSEAVELGSAGSADVQIEMGAGELDVSGGSSELLEATFVYNVEELNPSATFTGGNLVVTEEDVKEGFATLLDLDEYRNEWDLRLGEGVPMEMNIDLGAGRANLIVGSLALSRLTVRVGAGDVALDLRGSQSLEQFDFDLGAGDVTVDLTGDWLNDLDGTFQGGLGEITLKLPRDVGVLLDVSKGIGGIDTSGLSKDGDTYTNDAYGDSAVTLSINIDAGVGQINLEVE